MQASDEIDGTAKPAQDQSGAGAAPILEPSGQKPQHRRTSKARRGSRDQPARRPLQIYSFDPMLANTLERVGPGIVVVPIPWEPLEPGPCGARVEVIDFDGGRSGPLQPGQTDPAKRVFYEAVDLDDPRLAVQGGLAPTEADPRFHQQMVYAVAMQTLEAYDRALGRRIRLAAGKLRLFPHAFRGENAFYDPDLRAVLFGYFQADTTAPGPNLPGQPVFTALSHDIITHEVTHALIHRIRPMLLDNTNPDVAAFHEAIADLTAIFLHFRLPGVVEETIAALQTHIGSPSPLVELAGQFGYATGQGHALRTAIDHPDPTLYRTEMEPHARGSILVAAIFDAFLTIYQRRIADLLRLATGGSGILPQGALHPDLVARVSKEARRTAEDVLTICLRALDFLPPGDVTFSDLLRAIVTSDRDLFPTDGGGLRVAFVDAFRRRGIYPQDVVSLADGSLVWPGPPSHSNVTLPEKLRSEVLTRDTFLLNPWWPPHDPVQATEDAAKAEVSFARAPAIARGLQRYLTPHVQVFDMCPGVPLAVRGFHSMFRYDEDGAPHLEFVVQLQQSVDKQDAPGIADQALGAVVRRTSTIIFNEAGSLTRVISKPLPGPALPEHAQQRAKERLAGLADWFEDLEASDPGCAYGLTRPGVGLCRIDFASLHGRTR